MAEEMFPGDEELNQLFASAEKKSQEITSGKSDREEKRSKYIWAIMTLQDVNSSDKSINRKLEELNKEKSNSEAKLKQIEATVVQRRIVEKQEVMKEQVYKPQVRRPSEPIPRKVNPPQKVGFKGIFVALLIFMASLVATCIVWAPRVTALVCLTGLDTEWSVVIGAVCAFLSAILIETAIFEYDGFDEIWDTFKDIAAALWKLSILIFALLYFVIGNIKALIVGIIKKNFSPVVPNFVKRDDIGLGLLGVVMAPLLYVTLRYSFVQWDSFGHPWDYIGSAILLIPLFFYWGGLRLAVGHKGRVFKSGVIANIVSYIASRKSIRQYKENEHKLEEKYKKEMEDYQSKLVEYERICQLETIKFNQQCEEARKRYAAKSEAAQKKFMEESEQAEKEYRDKMAAKVDLMNQQKQVIEGIIGQINCQEHEIRRNVSKRTAITFQEAFRALKNFAYDNKALDSFYDSLFTRRCDCLEGREGAINIYNEDLRSARGLNPN